MGPRGLAPSWRIDLIVPHHAFGAFAQVLDPFTQAVSVSELPGPTGQPAWCIQGYADSEPDMRAVAAAAALAAFAASVPAPEPKLIPLGAVDWLAENRRGFPPIRAGRLYIHGSHLPDAAPPGLLSLQIDAATAFGSGEHGSTRGCLLALDGLWRAARVRRALDMGCGSGILSLAMASLWPASRVTAVDIDAESVRVARANARINRLAGRIDVRTNNGFAGRFVRGGAPFDLVVANILARPLVAMAPDVARVVRPGGWIVLSGLLAGQEREVAAAYRMQRLRLIRRYPVEGWHSLVMRRG